MTWLLVVIVIVGAVGVMLGILAEGDERPAPLARELIPEP